MSNTVVEKITESQAMAARDLLAIYQNQIEQTYEDLPEPIREKLDEELEGIASSYGYRVQEARDEAVTELVAGMENIIEEYGDEMVEAALSVNGGFDFPDELEHEYANVADVFKLNRQ
jgi:hypothetical protein